MGLGIRGAPKTVGRDDSEARTCSHLRLRHLAQVSAAKDAEQTHRAGRKASAQPRSERPAPPATLPIVGGRYVTREWWQRPPCAQHDQLDHGVEHLVHRLLRARSAAWLPPAGGPGFVCTARRQAQPVACWVTVHAGGLLAPCRQASAAAAREPERAACAQNAAASGRGGGIACGTERKSCES